MMNESDRVALNNSAVSDVLKQEDGNSAITSSAFAIAIVGQLAMSRTKSH